MSNLETLHNASRYSFGQFHDFQFDFGSGIEAEIFEPNSLSHTYAFCVIENGKFRGFERHADFAKCCDALCDFVRWMTANRLTR